MSLTPTYRAHLKRQWLGLAQDALAPARLSDPAAERRHTVNLLDWPSPLDEAADRLALYALARMSLAYLRAKTQAARELRRPALTALALLALELLGEDGPAAAPAQPTLPYRADLDG